MSSITSPKDLKKPPSNEIQDSAVTNTGTGTENGQTVPDSGSTPDSCRETLRINQEEQAFHHHLTLGLQEKLQKNRMIKNIKSQFRKPVDKQTLSYWERKNGVNLPRDLKEYYQSTNGFKLTWSLEHAGDVLPIGELSINQLNQLVEIHQAAKQSANNSNGGNGRGSSTSVLMRPKTCSSESLARHNSSSSSSSARKTEDSSMGSGTALFTELEQTLVGSLGHAKLPISGLNYNPSNKTFILDSGRSWGKVCLVYSTPPSSEPGLLNSPSGKQSQSKLETDEINSSPKPSPVPTKKNVKSGKSSINEPYVEIWFMDPSFQWHYLAPTFTHFYRMLLFHLGLPQWQYRFTPFGLSSWAEQMFWLVAPHLLQAPKLSRFPSTYHGEGLWCTDVPNEAATPNPTLNVLTNQLFRRKKKDKDKNQQ